MEDQRLTELREKLVGAQTRAQEAIDAVLALAPDAPADVTEAATVEMDEAQAESDRCKAEVDRREALLRARDQHTPTPLPEGSGGSTPTTGDGATLHARARGDQRDDMVYRPNQRGGVDDNKGFFYDLAMAENGDQRARERLMRNNQQAIEAVKNDTKIPEGERQMRAGDLTTATHMGEFIVPDWTNQLYAPLLRAGRVFADQCINLGAPVSNSWNLPRITTGATTAAQTEGSALSNTDQVSDSIAAILQTFGGYSIASYQLVDLAEPGMDGILFADLLGSLNQQIDNSLLNSSTASAQGAFGLTGINSITFTAATPTGPLLWPAIFQAKSAIEKNTFLPVDFCVMHPSTWNWFLSTLDSQNRPLALDTTGSSFNDMADYSLTAQGIAGNIGGIPVLVDANVTVTDGAGTNQSKILLANRSALLKKEGTPRFKVADQTLVTSLMYTFVAFAYLQRMFGRHPKKISAITGTGLVVQSNF